ncbi:MAG: hypothetical protein K8S13_21310 [Desulfobacula sp.]|uniref:hypothetical protein n=1 Tax=Desulfobacula sp. TaxID=2593537 RepID=UPI0025C0D9B0|nr:hypothetical protein [Desulfobacula sp.]MCD4722372.1 hypothetical protein [Desulfobacula sp.]
MSILNKKECFGSQGRDMLYGDSPDQCLDCELFDKYHKISIAGCLQGISSDLDLIVQNGLTTGFLKAYMELEKFNEIMEKKLKKKDN